MINKHFTFKTKDTNEHFVYKWLPDNNIKLKAVVQIAHGMAEQASRYECFAEFLTKNGYIMYANDHLGHGKTAGDLKNVGFFAEQNGWNLVTENFYELTKIINNENPNLPVFLLGHSMGSFIVRTYISQYNNNLKGVILSGTAGSAGLLGKIGLGLTKLLIAIHGKKSPSKLLNQLSFGEFNKGIKPSRTAFDWLSRDEKEVDKYIADPYCGGIFTLGFFEDLIKGVDYVNSETAISKISKQLPVFFFAGEKDPVGNYSKGVTEVIEKFKKAGIGNITSKFYKDGRHESLNEINRDKVFNDVLAWLNKNL